MKAFVWALPRPLGLFGWLREAAGRFVLCAAPEPVERPLSLDGQSRVALALGLYGDTILRLCFSYLHNRGDAEDVLQDTLIKLMERAPDFESPEHQKAWLMRVAINLCKNKLKYNSRRNFEPLTASIPDEAREELSFLWEAVGELPTKYREVIHLFYQEDMPVAQIARLLQKRESTVRSLLLRGRKLLKETLAEVYDFAQ